MARFLLLLSVALALTLCAAALTMVPLAIRVGCGAKQAYPLHRDVLRYTIDQPTASLLLIHFAHVRLAPSDYIVLRPIGRNATSRTMTPARVTASSSGAFFAMPLYASRVIVELHTMGLHRGGDDCVGFAIDGVRTHADARLRMPKDDNKESLCGADDSKNAMCYVNSAMFTASKAVVRLLTNRASGSDFCTGWLLGCAGHVLTNQHCLLSAADARNTQFEFMAQGATCQSDCEASGACASRIVVQGGTLLASSKALDYALVQLENVPSELGYLQLRAAGPQLNERVYIPQYPLGGGKRLAVVKSNQPGTITSVTLSGCAKNQAGYMLDTQPGSSGSPVLASSDNTVVALHHCGGCPNAGIQAQFIIRDLSEKGLLPPCAVA
ncbi:hypothetical protein SPRG_09022 [Saprolegnia parasitica CBS 223.65]|uniref:Serine protease n=1 Tax=Saprolegnia parasitica (strain CBS 223.65) TaxID=695850 RepID=A0A067C5F5_SAPPC|nr:hypothetical protein SPRG_09022 [Saprolegnia parasitica CBS 223.65]KDO25723.1 hypothetical protein SPRG_09022 [Saprolegnia parasitica CBS 223.65]|eukprot:XP_012203533.1 hypothetical protein SPRG_09022 [Saprolegnia parasitica CBS 223.65]